MKKNNSFLLKYKNIHKGQKAVLFGSGPTIKNFDPITIPSDFIKAGSNEQIFLDLDLDYWFMCDTTDDKNKFWNKFDNYNNYKPKKSKFIADMGEVRNKPPKGIKHAEYYYSEKKHSFTKNIDSELIPTKSSITFDIVQFLLYMGIKIIYLVGHDCDYSKGTFTGTKIGKYQNSGPSIIERWKNCNKWINEEYPDTKIYSINPVKLKLFEIKNKIE